MQEREQIRLHNLRPAEGSRKNRKRVGRGDGSGLGTTAGRGTKGQRSRSGSTKNPGFEGGQMPLYRRVPKFGGFTPLNRVEYTVVNVCDLERFGSGAVVDHATLAGAGLIRKERDRVKILGDGELTCSLTVKANAFTKSARQKIEAAGGSVEVI